MDTPSLILDDESELTAPEPGVSRRRMLKRAVGLAAVGAVGGSVLAEAMASPASAATTTETGAISPAVVTLPDAATITLDASLGNDFRVAIAGNRAIANPLTPADGQKIVLQITQGASGGYTVTWGSAFEFSTGLPQPTLSTAAGETDLLAFIFNASKGKWLFVAYVNGFDSTAAAQPTGTYRLFSGVAGPAAAASYTGPFLAGILFKVTSGGTWLDGYWWWVCPSGQSVAPQKFSLWCIYDNSAGTLVPGSTVTSGPLTAGQWNYVSLPAPLPLAIGASYVASTGLSNGFPSTTNQFGSGQPYAAGIVSGPLTAFSDLSGTMPTSFGMSQALFGITGTDPSVNMPTAAYQSSNFWVDVQIDTAPPAGTSYRLWPSYPRIPGTVASETQSYNLATEFQLSRACTLGKIWFYSPAGSAVLPTRCAIWNVATQAEVTGTDNPSPSWSGTAGSGWVSCQYSGITLPAGDYKVSAFSGGGSQWFQVTPSYFGTGGPGANGIDTGPLVAPGNAAATSPGQATYSVGTWTYPLTYGSGGNGENLWVDVEVTPA